MVSDKLRAGQKRHCGKIEYSQGRFVADWSGEYTLGSGVMNGNIVFTRGDFVVVTINRSGRIQLDARPAWHTPFERILEFDVNGQVLVNKCDEFHYAKERGIWFARYKNVEVLGIVNGPRYEVQWKEVWP